MRARRSRSTPKPTPFAAGPARAWRGSAPRCSARAASAGRCPRPRRRRLPARSRCVVGDLAGRPLGLLGEAAEAGNLVFVAFKS